MKKNLIIIIAVFITLTFEVQAQSDSISLFRTPGKSGVKSRANSVGNNLLGISLNHLSRGGSSISYERLIGGTGLSAYAGIGISLRDVWGQYSYSREGPIIYDDFSEVKNFTFGRILDFGLKYYFEKQTGGFFIGSGLTSITNTIYTGYDFAYEYKGIQTNSTLKLNYTSNEIKLILGHVNSQEDRFYSEFALGPQLRFMGYDQVQYERGSTINGIQYTVTKDYIEEIKIGIFLGWKIGLRF
jgi:hypothetical protein